VILLLLSVRCLKLGGLLYLDVVCKEAVKGLKLRLADHRVHLQKLVHHQIVDCTAVGGDRYLRAQYSKNDILKPEKCKDGFAGTVE
jgi:hypothetical protein